MTLLEAAAAIAGVAFVVALAATPAARSLAFALGVVDKPNPRKVHAVPTPMLGGLAVLAGLIAGLALGVHYRLLELEFAPFRGIAIGAVMVVLLGVIDDKFGVTPKWKLVGQALGALLLVLHEVKLTIFLRENVITTILTVIWIVGITNSFNLLDNMNGLSSGVGIIASFAFAWVAYEQNDWFTLVIASALFGSALGFLPHNFPGARIFLGDAGSMLIGFTLAAVSVQGIYLQNTQLLHLPVITPLLILGVPLFDTLSVIVIRMARGLPIFQADKNHFSHRLVDLGMTQPQAVGVIWLVAVAVAIPATLLSHVDRHEAILLLVQEVILFVIIVALMRAGILRGAERDKGLPPPGHEEDRER